MKTKKQTKKTPGTSLVVQWLRLHPSKAGGADLIPGQGTRIPHAASTKQNPSALAFTQPDMKYLIWVFGFVLFLKNNWSINEIELGGI